jgi:hypothetical protein
MMMREDCEKGFFVSFDFTSDALQEIESFFERSHKVIVALTVQGMDVYGLMDAAGDATCDAHKYGVKRMTQAGVIPLTWETITSE